MSRSKPGLVSGRLADTIHMHFRQEKDLAASRQNVAARRSFDPQLEPAELFGLIEQRFCGAA
jgi:hypothetical protein